MPDKYTKKAKRLLHGRKFIQEYNLTTGEKEAAAYGLGFNDAKDDCTPIVADLLEQIDKLTKKMEKEKLAKP